jgi:hypothetical protein
VGVPAENVPLACCSNHQPWTRSAPPLSATAKASNEYAAPVLACVKWKLTHARQNNLMTFLVSTYDIDYYAPPQERRCGVQMVNNHNNATGVQNHNHLGMTLRGSHDEPMTEFQIDANLLTSTYVCFGPIKMLAFMHLNGTPLLLITRAQVVLNCHTSKVRSAIKRLGSSSTTGSRFQETLLSCKPANLFVPKSLIHPTIQPS